MESKEGLERVEAMLTGVSDAKKFLTDSHQKKKNFLPLKQVCFILPLDKRRAIC